MNHKHLYYLIGKSGSGKDSIFAKLQEEFAMRPLLLFTTRPMREGEEDGREYYFVTPAFLEKVRADGKILEERTYYTVNGPWTYFTALLEDYQRIDLSAEDYLGIGTIASYRKLSAAFGEGEVIPLYIEVEDGLRLLRSLEREREQKKPNYAEICRRFLADQEDFSEGRIREAGIVKRFSNDKSQEECVKEVAAFIREIQKSAR